MNLSVYRISLDVHDAHSGECLDMKQKDTARQIAITLTDGGFPYQIGEECYAVFAATKADGKKLRHHCSIEKNTILYEVRPQTTAAVGLMECEIKLYGSGDKLLMSPGFSILVSEDAVTDDDELESEDEVDDLTHLISEATTVITEGKQLMQEMTDEAEGLAAQVSEAKSAATRANTAATRANLFNENASKHASAASTSADLAVTYAGKAETAAQNAETSAERASTSATTAASEADRAEAGASSANSWAKTANTSAMQANAAATTANTKASAAASSAERAEAAAKRAEEAADGAGNGSNSGQNHLDLTFHNGRLYITVDGVRTGNGVVIGTVEETVYHDIVLNLTNCVSSNDVVQVEEHGEYTTVISAKTGYIMNLLTVTMGGEVLTPDNGTIHITDVTGEIQITASAIANTADIDLSGIVDWYKAEVQDAIAHVDSLGTSEWVHHIVTTDLHYPINCRNSMPIVKSLMGTGRFDKHMLLGDITDSSNPEDFQSLLYDGLSDLNDCTLFTLGNHDWQKSNGVRYISNTEYKDAIMANVDATWVDAENLFYYYDDPARKIRYIGINIGDALTTTDQIIEVIRSLGADWTFFILCHYAALGSDSDNDVFAGAWNYVTSLLPGYIMCDATFGGWICGHYHIDHVRYGDYDPFPQVTLDCDTNKLTAVGSDHNPGWSSNPRTAGTTSEHAITIMSINVGSGEVKFHRIGAYQNKFGKDFGYIFERRAGRWVKGMYTSGTYALSANENGWTKITKEVIPESSVTDGVDMRFTEDSIRDGSSGKWFLTLLSTPYSDAKFMRLQGNQPNAKLAPYMWAFKGATAAVKAAAAGGVGFKTAYADGWNPPERDIEMVKAADYVYPRADTVKTCNWYDGYRMDAALGYIASETSTSSSAIKVKPSTTYNLRFDNADVSSSFLRISMCAANCALIKCVSGTIEAGGVYSFATLGDCEFIAISINDVMAHKDSIVLEEASN